MDISVVITTHLVANKASLSYLAAKIAAGKAAAKKK